MSTTQKVVLSIPLLVLMIGVALLLSAFFVVEPTDNPALACEPPTPTPTPQPTIPPPCGGTGNGMPGGGGAGGGGMGVGRGAINPYGGGGGGSCVTIDLCEDCGD